MTTAALLDDLRHGRDVSADALGAFAAGLAHGSVSDAQAGAFAMAVCMGRGLGPAGRVALTRAMAASGDTLRWDLPGPVIDKHSTGGVGDPVSLLLAPMLASVGCYVPMISGRGLGHTGGTLDKLEAIQGLSVEVPTDRFRAIVGDVGCAIVAASGDIAPADRRLYALRDVTGTVDQIDLITASILAKKLAAGLDALVLDVKVGSGAFMADLDAARDLAHALVETAKGAGCAAAALITDMDQPLAPACGNAVEVACVMRALAGEGGPLVEVAVALGEQLLALAVRGGDLRATLTSGAAMERFAAMVAAMGGPVDFARTWQRDLPTSPVRRDVPCATDGVVTSVDGRALGHLVISLGGGRLRDGDRIDATVGLTGIARIGDRLAKGDPLAVIHAPDEVAAARARRVILQAIVLGDAATPPPLIVEAVT